MMIPKEDSQALRSILIGKGHWGSVLERYLRVDSRFCLHRIYGRDFDVAHIPQDCDVAFITTPLSAHYELALACLERDLHIFVEKPTCRTLYELETLYGIAMSKQRKIYTDYIYLTSPSIREIQMLIGKLGQLHHIDSHITQYGRFYPNENALEVLGVHLLSVFVWLFGDIYILSHHITSPNDILLHLESTQSQCPISLHCSLESTTKRREIHIYGSHGELHFDACKPEPLQFIHTHGIKHFALDERHNIAHTLALFYDILYDEDLYARHRAICMRIVRLLEAFREAL